MNRDKQNIKTTDWLTEGCSQEELKIMKEKAIKEAEIELMAKIIHNGELARNRGDLDCTEFATDLVIKVGLQRLAGAKALYNEGYRKTSDVVKEIFEEIEKEIELALDCNYKVKRDAQDDNDTLVTYVEGKIDCLRGLLGFLYELKKKHESEGER